MIFQDEPKIAKFLKWLRDNGAVYDMIDLASFEGGLMGISAKRPIG
jgi:myo-inositol-1-phosphate synthase